MNTSFKTLNNKLVNRLSSSLKSLLAVAFFSSVFINNAIAYEELETFSINKMDDAQVFAEFSDKMPFVVNYFTSATEADILAFYQENYGDVISQERKRGRLTSYYSVNEMAVRVVISQQNKKRQVDILVEQSASL